MRKALAFQVLLILIIFPGCNRSRIYEKNINLEDRLWQQDSALVFQFDVTDINSHYNLSFNVRNSILYPFQNLYLIYSLEDTLGNVIETGLKNFTLFDSKTGKPLGDGLGDIFDHRFPVSENYRFNNPGTYRLKIKQYMRMDMLPEIMSVGLRIDLSE